MKKSYLMIAAAAGLMLTACSQEDDFVAQNAAAEQGDGAVLFDTYLSNNATRAGEKGVMTTSTLQKTGFGIMASTHDISTPKVAGTDIALAPNFMWNQYVGYEASNWTYSPLKYWPNETKKGGDADDKLNVDQQSIPATSNGMEGVSFFAYAPYVKETTTAATAPAGVKDNFVTVTATGSSTGIMAITKNDYAKDPMVYYTINSTTPSDAVDLLWGVSSGFTYHPVKTGSAVVQTAGYPVLNMEKPALDEKIKFDFKHALARIGMTVVGAFDQQAVGGSLHQNTRVTVKEVKVSGKFQDAGVLDLNNADPNTAKWLDPTDLSKDLAAPATAKVITISGAELNPDIKYMNGVAANQFPAVIGVSTNSQDVISIGRTYNTVDVGTGKTLPLDGTTYYTTKALATPAYPVYPALTGTNYYYTFDGANREYNSAGQAEIQFYDASSPAATDGTVYYTLKMNTGVTGKTGAVIKTDLKDMAKTWYTWAEATGLKKATGTLVDATTYYNFEDFTATIVKPVYKEGTYFTQKNIPGYFMVIPTREDPSTKDYLDVDVTITYYVTTLDPQLLNGTYHTSEVENVISQKVRLEKFTNGKAYNLKLILGLTSVKVEAEVSNWEVGTVESNLPQNLE